MTNTSLAQSYLVKALKRLKILTVLLDDDAYVASIHGSSERWPGQRRRCQETHICVLRRAIGMGWKF